MLDINTFWCDSDIINMTEGLELSELSSHHNLHQLINTPTHIIPNPAFCIDLLFTSQPNLISESGVHASLSFQGFIIKLFMQKLI